MEIDLFFNVLIALGIYLVAILALYLSDKKGSVNEF